MPIEPAKAGNNTTAQPPPRQEFLGLHFDCLDLADTVQALTNRSAAAPFAYLVTPNVDHMVRLHDRGDSQHDRLWRAYRGADWCLCDSRILARLAATRGVRIPVVPGSDLACRLLQSEAMEGAEVMVVGSDSDAVDALRLNFPKLRFVHHAPPFNLRYDDAALDAAVDFVVEVGAPYVFLAVGSPQQELLAARIRERAGARGVGLCIGAAIDFVTGRQKRAPRLVQRLHLEWAHRLLTNPRRLWRRYLVDGPMIFALVRRWRPDSSVSR